MNKKIVTESIDKQKLPSPPSITAIDLSGPEVRLVSGYFNAETKSVMVIGAVKGEPLPVDKQGFLETDATVASLKTLLPMAFSNPGVKAENTFYVAILPPTGLLVKAGQGRTATVGSGICFTDYQNCTNIITRQVKEPGKTVVSIDPYSFLYSGNTTAVFPVGQSSDDLEVYGDAYLIDTESYRHSVDILEKAGISPYLLLVSPFCGMSFINSFEGPNDYDWLSLGERESVLCFVKEKRLFSSDTLPFGIADLLQHVSDTLRLPLSTVTEYSHLYGFRDDMFPDFLTQEGKSLHTIGLAFQQGLQDLIAAIKKIFLRDKILESRPLLFSGSGTTSIEGLKEYLGIQLSMNTYLVTASAVGARDKEYLACLGGIVTAFHPYQPPLRIESKDDSDMGLATHDFGRN